MDEANEWDVSVDSAEAAEPESWPMRPLLLALLGAVAGLVVHLLLPEHAQFSQLSGLQLAEIAGVITGAGVFGFTLERRSWLASLLFSAATAVVAVGIVYWNGSPAAWSGGDAWRIGCLAIAIAIAAPLFQAARDEGRVGFRYAAVHDRAWSNIVLWCACWAFVGIVFLLILLLSELFRLINLHFLSDLLREKWFVLTLVGLAFGGALGLFREFDAVVRLLQRVVLTVLAVLAPVLGLGLAVFLLALPFTGLAPLWKSWVDSTSLLLACVAGALILANTVIGNTPEHESRLLPLRIGAMVLAVAMLPLAVLAAVAIGMRIDQYGFTPERLWALTFVVLACAVGLAYLVSLVRGRMDWARYVRPANLNLAFGVCGVALLLATPLISFNSISTNDQIARLNSGRIAPGKFDWRALAFDFGKPGRDALARLARSHNGVIRDQATVAEKAKSRWEITESAQRESVAANLRLLPQGSVLPDSLRAAIAARNECVDASRCTLFLVPDGHEALLLRDDYFPAPGEHMSSDRAPWRGQLATRFTLVDGNWTDTVDEPESHLKPEEEVALANGFKAGKIEVRPVQRRQMFVGGVPVGDAFE